MPNITDQEIAFADLILAGSMTDQYAAAAVGLDPATAAYIKSKPCVLAYMLERRAAMQQQTESVRCLIPSREQVLDRLWEIARIGPEITRGTLTGQVKAISMIIAIEGLIPDRRARSAEPASPPPKVHIYESEWLREQREKDAAGLQPNAVKETQEEVEPDVPQAELAPAPVVEAPPAPAEPTVAERFKDTQWVPDADFTPDTRVPFSIQKGPFSRRRR